jgi:hypothetical protein
MKSTLYFLLFVLISLAGTVAHAQSNSSQGNVTDAIKNVSSAQAKARMLNRVESATRLNTEQVKALLSESMLMQRYFRALEGVFSWDDCQLVLPVEPGEVSYSSGVRLNRKWINKPPQELEALDQLQCDVCKWHKDRIINDSQRKFAEDWIIQIYVDMLRGSWESDHK